MDADELSGVIDKRHHQHVVLPHQAEHAIPTGRGGGTARISIHRLNDVRRERHPADDGPADVTIRQGAEQPAVLVNDERDADSTGLDDLESVLYRRLRSDDDALPGVHAYPCAR